MRSVDLHSLVQILEEVGAARSLPASPRISAEHRPAPLHFALGMSVVTRCDALSPHPYFADDSCASKCLRYLRMPVYIFEIYRQNTHIAYNLFTSRTCFADRASYRASIPSSIPRVRMIAFCKRIHQQCSLLSHENLPGIARSPRCPARPSPCDRSPEAKRLKLS